MNAWWHAQSYIHLHVGHPSFSLGACSTFTHILAWVYTHADEKIQTCDMAHAHTCHGVLIRTPWLVRYVCHDSMINMQMREDFRLTCDMTHSHIFHYVFIRLPWLNQYVCHDSINMCAMTDSICVPWLNVEMRGFQTYVWHDAFTYMPWRIHMCAMTKSMCLPWLNSCVPWLNVQMRGFQI